MSKRTYFKRYLWLFDLIKNKPYITFDEIVERFNNSGLSTEDEAAFSKRTFIRDKAEILDLFGIEIIYDSSRKGYYVDDDCIKPNNQFLLDSYRYINTYQIFKDIDRYIATEPRRSGSEHLLLILDCIQNRKTVEFVYCKYIDDTPEKRIIEPYFVKEFKGRWYVIARDKKDQQIKSFALERIKNDPLPASPSSSFNFPHNIKPESFFKDSFGIFKENDKKTEEIILSFKPLKGMFIKSQPLHASQTIIIDNKEEFRVKLYLQITHDFIMELLSHGSEVKVISPNSLKVKLKEILVESLKQYKDE